MKKPHSSGYEPYAYTNIVKHLNESHLLPYFSFELVGTEVLQLHKQKPHLKPAFDEDTAVPNPAAQEHFMRAGKTVMSLYQPQNGSAAIASVSYDKKDLLAIFATVAHIAVNKRHDVYVLTETMDRKDPFVMPYPHELFAMEPAEMKIKAEGFFGNIADAAGIPIPPELLIALPEGRVDISDPIFKKRVPIQLVTQSSVAGLN